jgi:hypothetical protein
MKTSQFHHTYRALQSVARLAIFASCAGSDITVDRAAELEDNTDLRGRAIGHDVGDGEHVPRSVG